MPAPPGRPRGTDDCSTPGWPRDRPAGRRAGSRHRPGGGTATTSRRRSAARPRRPWRPRSRIAFEPDTAGRRRYTYAPHVTARILATLRAEDAGRIIADSPAGEQETAPLGSRQAEARQFLAIAAA